MTRTTAAAQKGKADEKVWAHHFANVVIVASEGTEDDSLQVELTFESTDPGTDGVGVIKTHRGPFKFGNSTIGDHDQELRFLGRDLDRLIRCLTSVRDRQHQAARAASGLDRTDEHRLALVRKA